MKTRIAKRGNSLWIKFPKQIVAKVGWKPGVIVRFVLEDGAIKIAPVTR